MQVDVACGIDVSAKTLAVRYRRDGKERQMTVGNDRAGHREIVRALGKRARVCMEATGVYHLQLAMALRAVGIDVMVINPRVAKDFARALQSRSKTDTVDAAVLLEYVRRMEFQPWATPGAATLELRELGRRMGELTQLSVAEQNRLHAKHASAISRRVAQDVREHVEQLAKRIRKIEAAAIDVIQADSRLREQYSILLSAKGIGPRSAVLLLAELTILDPTMTTRQLVAYAGLDPRVFESGTSVHKGVRISKVGNARLRAILYLVAMSAIRHDRGAKAFFRGLTGRGKKRMQALVAVMRKILHGIWIALQRRVAFDSTVLFAASLAQAESSDSAMTATKPEHEPDQPEGRSPAEEPRQQLESAHAEPTRRRKGRSLAA